MVTFIDRLGMPEHTLSTMLYVCMLAPLSLNVKRAPVISISLVLYTSFSFALVYIGRMRTRGWKGGEGGKARCLYYLYIHIYRFFFFFFFFFYLKQKKTIFFDH